MNAKLRKISRRLLLPIFLVLATFALSPSAATFFESPPATARWEVALPRQFHLGEVIRATLVVTTVSGVSLDTSHMPDVGEVIKLPAKLLELSSEDSTPGYDIQPTAPEGELEVVSRRITRHLDGVLVVTRISYGLIYLLEIDIETSADEKRLPQYLPIFQEYSDRRYGKISRVTRTIAVDPADLLIVPRVDDNSQPIFRLAQVTLPSSPWSYLRLAGFAGLGLAICLIARRALVLIPRRRPNQTRMVDQPPAARVLFELWCEKPESSAFIEAVKLYRTGVWGQPHASLWFLTTFVLYSGVELNHDQAKSVFARLVEEASNDSA